MTRLSFLHIKLNVVMLQHVMEEWHQIGAALDLPVSGKVNRRTMMPITYAETIVAAKRVTLVVIGLPREVTRVFRLHCARLERRYGSGIEVCAMTPGAEVSFAAAENIISCMSAINVIITAADDDSLRFAHLIASPSCLVIVARPYPGVRMDFRATPIGTGWITYCAPKKLPIKTRREIAAGTYVFVGSAELNNLMSGVGPDEGFESDHTPPAELSPEAQQATALDAALGALIARLHGSDDGHCR
jgi:hypothetical protein